VGPLLPEQFSSPEQLSPLQVPQQLPQHATQQLPVQVSLALPEQVVVSVFCTFATAVGFAIRSDTVFAEAAPQANKAARLTTDTIFLSMISPS
jgi:hypothetical protein